MNEPVAADQQESRSVSTVSTSHASSTGMSSGPPGNGVIWSSSDCAVLLDLSAIAETRPTHEGRAVQTHTGIAMGKVSPQHRDSRSNPRTARVRPAAVVWSASARAILINLNGSIRSEDRGCGVQTLSMHTNKEDASAHMDNSDIEIEC